MSSAQGRFTSTDPNSAGASLFDPQSWNAYSYTLNNPLKYVDPDGDVPIPVITGAVGAGVGAIVGGGVEAFSQLARTGRIESKGRIVTAILSGGLAGGIAGLTLGVGAGAGVIASTTEVIGVNAASSVLGGTIQRGTNEAFDLEEPASASSEIGNVVLEGTLGGLGGLWGGKAADKLFPIPNVRAEIELLKYAHRRSTRAARIAARRTFAESQAKFNSVIGGVIGGVRSEGIKFLWNWIVDPPAVQAQPKPKKKKDKDYEVDTTIIYEF
jgi:hypothetical protein